MKESLIIGDTVFNSPVGSGTITDITDAGYPRVNYIAVGRLVHKGEDGSFYAFDPNGTYAKGDWEMFLDDERFPGPSASEGVVVVRSSAEAIAFCEAVGSFPKNIVFDHDLGEDDTAMVFCRWLTDKRLDYKDKDKWKFRKDFVFSVHSQNPVGKRNIIAYVLGLLRATEPEIYATYAAVSYLR